MTNIFRLNHLVLYQARKCSDKSNVQKYRKLVLFLSLIENRFLPADITRQILDFGRGDYNTHTADACIKRLLDKRYLLSIPKSYHDRFTLYSLTASGFNKMIELLVELNQANLELPDPAAIKKLYDSHRSDSSSPHMVAESITYVLLLLHLPAGKIISLDKEVQYETARGLRIKKEKLSKNLISDINFLTASPSPQRTTCCEIDLLTERMTGSNGIREKGLAYAALFTHMNAVNFHNSLQVIFSIFDDGWTPPRTGTNIYSEEEVRTFSCYLPPYYFYLSLLDLALKYKTPGRLHTLADAITFLLEESADLNKNVYRDRGKQYSTFLTLLQATARTIAPYDDTPFSSIRNSIDLAAKHSNKGREHLIQNHYQEIYKKRRTAICNMVFKELDEGNHASSLAMAISKGMMFACSSGRYPELHLPWLLPELFFQDLLPEIISNLGITMHRQVMTTAYCIPLRGHETKDYYGIAFNDFDTYSRCVFMCGQITICIENISDDIGGYVRAKEYLRLFPGFRSKTIMILLINDDYILADGSHIDDCTLYQDRYLDEGNELLESTYGKHFIHYGNCDIVALLAGYLSEYRFVNQEYNSPPFIPYLFETSQDFIMITYSQFLSAADHPATPWLILPDDCGTIKVSRGQMLPNKQSITVPAHISKTNVTQAAPRWDHLF